MEVRGSALARFCAGIAIWVAVAGVARAAAADEVDDSGRFYVYFQTGHAGVLDKHVAGDANLDTPDGFNLVLGGGGGYNIDRHWGVELQAHGTEPDVRSDQYGKIKEFSNITIVPALRWRYPIGRLVPYLTLGVGGSLNEVNDTGNPRIKLEADRSSVVGAVGLGLEYFLADDVAIGAAMHTFIYPDVDTSMVVRDQANRVTFRDDSSVDLTAISALVHMRIFLGEQADDGKPRRLFLADRGPFDTEDPRGYLYLLGGHTQLFDTDFIGGMELKAPGDFNATLGGGLGVNLSRHWGAEIQLLNTEPNINLSGIGKFAELSNFTVMPLARFRWPFQQGRLVAFATAGIGVAFNDVNDARESVDQFNVGTVTAPKVRIIDETSIAGQVGFGVEYFLNRHLSFGAAVPIYIYPDWDAEARFGTAQQPGGGGNPAGRGTVRDSFNFSSIAGILQIKVYLP
jgi:opacity protein-like surface antigen